MGFDLVANNKEAGDLHMGVSWLTLQQYVGCIWPVDNVSNSPRWMMTTNTEDKRFKPDHNYPINLTNDGFEVTEEEAKWMARCAANVVAIHEQFSKEREHHPEEFLILKTERLKHFAEWAPKSGGFQVW